jgi:CheY-like chemotaxis protein
LADRTPLCILLAEDNLINQKVALLMLKKLGYMADTAINGKEVLRALEIHHYDIILMDIQMPEMDGLEATRQIRERWPDKRMKIVAVTAHALDFTRKDCLDAGMDDYITKPLTIEDLKMVLDMAKDTRDMPSAHYALIPSQ